jgi:adenylate cyclase
MARITIHGPRGRSERKLFRHNSLGRHPGNTHQVLDQVVSKEHCHIDLVNGRYVLRDLESLNGTFLNGERVSESFLSSGDEINIGSTTITFRVDPASIGPSLPALFADQASADARRLKLDETSSAGPLIRSKISLADDKTFVAEELIDEERSLRRDYEKLRASYEVMKAIGIESSIVTVCNKLLDVALRLVPADRGVVLLYDEQGNIEPCALLMKEEGGSEQELMVSRTVLETALADKEAVLCHDAAADVRFRGAQSIIMQGIRSTMCVPLIHGTDVLGAMMLDSRIATHAFTEKDLSLFETVASQAAVAIQNTLYAKQLEREAVTRERFRRLLSPAIAEQVLSGAVEVAQGGELRETTVLFADIRGFTSLAEAASPQAVVEALNAYFERMVEIVFRHEGTLDKFVGDEIMALFGAPVSHSDDPVRAVTAALQMQEALVAFNEERAGREVPPFEIGVGINTGEVVAGYIGSSQAMEYTVIGDPVNTGARLCAIAQPGQVLISEPTLARLGDAFDVQELPEAKLKGKSKPLRVFEVRGLAA